MNCFVVANQILVSSPFVFSKVHHMFFYWATFHRDTDGCIGSNFCKFYPIGIDFTFGFIWWKCLEHSKWIKWENLKVFLKRDMVLVTTFLFWNLLLNYRVCVLFSFALFLLCSFVIFALIKDKKKVHARKGLEQKRGRKKCFALVFICDHCIWSYRYLCGWMVGQF